MSRNIEEDDPDFEGLVLIGDDPLEEHVQHPFSEEDTARIIREIETDGIEIFGL